MFLNDINVKPILARHEAFWKREIVDRVCISVTAPADKQVAVPKARSDEELLSNPEFVVRREEARLQNTYFAGDALPVAYAEGNLLYPCWGGLGRFEKGTVWVDPSMHDLQEWKDLRVDRNNIWIKRFLDSNCALAEASKGRYLVGTQGFFGAMDALALVRGYVDFLMELGLEEVGPSLHLAQRKAIELHKEIITKAWNDVEKYQKGTVTTPGIWAPGRINFWSADFSCMIGPSDLEKWLIPEFEEMVNLCEFSMYHLDGPDAVRHLSRIGQMKNLKGIQFTIGPQMENDVPYWLGVVKQIQALGKATFIYFYEKPELLETVLKARCLKFT